jgi:hypothetical protein
MLSDLRESPLVWDLSDDVRTEYRLVGGRGGSLGGRVWHGDVLFTPGPPADAHQLRPAVNGSGTAVPIRPLRTTG